MAAVATSWNLSEMERSELANQVSQLHRSLAAEVQGMSLSQWDLRPDADTWSAAEIVEHVLLVETSLMRQILEHSGDTPRADWEFVLRGKADFLRKVLPGGGKAKAGPSVTRFEGLALARVPDALADSREKLEELLLGTRDLPLKAILWGNRWFGDLSAYLWLLYIPLHGEGHLGQLKRQFGDRAFPSTKKPCH